MNQNSAWKASNWPELHGLNIEQVAQMGGKFYTPGGAWTDPCWASSWFVPIASHLPIMIRTDAGWAPRGF